MKLEKILPKNSKRREIALKIYNKYFKKYKLDVDKQLLQCYLNSIDVSTPH